MDHPFRLELDTSLTLVGNAPGIGEAAAAIDATEDVVRFNNAPGFGGSTGSRVTFLALVNRGGQMREWLEDPDFLKRPVVRQTRAFILPFPMLRSEENGPEQVCWTREALAMLEPLGKPIHILPEAVHRAARYRLAPQTVWRPNPSTGFLVAFAILLARSAGSAPVEAYGFGFAGWAGHPWAAERACFAEAEAAGRLRLHAPSTSDG